MHSAAQPPPDDFDALFSAALNEPHQDFSASKSAVLSLAERVLYWTIRLQVRSNIPVAADYWLGPAGAPRDGYSEVPIAAPWVASAATGACLTRVIAAFNAGSQFSWDADQLIRQLDLAALEEELKPFAVGGTNQFHLMQAALAMDVPCEHLASGVMMFGTGHRARWMHSTITDRTPAIGVKLAREKQSTATMLRRSGLPAAQHVRVKDEASAVRAAERLGYPVVVKPGDLDQGRGVAADLRSPDAVRDAFIDAVNVSPNVLVERHFHGSDYRLTVANGAVIKIERRIAGGVTGDGTLTVDELVHQEQATPRMQRILRGRGELLIRLDEEAFGMLEERGMTAQSVPPAGEYIPLRRKNNISTGGRQIGIAPADAHPDNLALAIRAAALLRLDFAGIDLLIEDIAKSWMETGALICEVNAQPQIGIRTSPGIYREVLADLLNGDGRIPVHLIVTDREKNQHTEAYARQAETLGCNGLSARDGVWIDGGRIVAQPKSAFNAAKIMLAEPTITSALCVISLDEVLQHGLPERRFRSIQVLSSRAGKHPVERRSDALTAMLEPHAERLAFS